MQSPDAVGLHQSIACHVSGANAHALQLQFLLGCIFTLVTRLS